MTTLTPAAELAAKSTPYPNDSAEYRAARTALLAEEIELRRHIERVAAQRRQLPPGGAAHGYTFLDQDGKTVTLAEMFGKHDTLVSYFWMYGPQRERPCPMCTALLDVWIKRDGKVRHFWASELGGTEDPDQDPRGAPDPTPLWNILDLTPAGRGTGWYPKLYY